MDISSLISASGKPRAAIIADAGISQAYLSLLENGHRAVSLKVVGRLARALGVSPSDLRPDLSEVFSQTSKPSSEAFGAVGNLPDANVAEQSPDCQATVSDLATIGGDNL